MTNDHYKYSAATPADLDSIWDKNIADNPGDSRWIEWKSQYIEENRLGLSKTFVVLYDGAPIGEGTLLLSPLCGAAIWMPEIADGKDTVNINALRIDRLYEGYGHISALVKLMEAYAREAGFKTATIGVEAREARSLAIYLHWGYTSFVRADNEDGELVLYYAKTL